MAAAPRGCRLPWASPMTGTPVGSSPRKTDEPPAKADGSYGWFTRGTRSAGLAVDGVATVLGAELLQLQPVGVVAPVLLGDVVPLLALGARERDLGADVAALAGHGLSFVVRLCLCE